jgi:hypothetical protein
MIAEENAIVKTSLGQMDGNDWERYCDRLLRIRYQDYQRVPARFGGDYGIEGFTFSGITFQCYCPEGDPEGKDLYEKQRDKITADIGKLIKNANKISELGAGIVKEWQFLSAAYDNKDLLQHCRSKETDVLNKGLKAISTSFKILLKSEDDFIAERQIYLGSAMHKIHPSAKKPQPHELEELFTSDNEIIQNIKTKLEKLMLPASQWENLTRDSITNYIVGQDELEELNRRFPDTYESVVQIKAAIESQLSMRTLSCSNNHGKILKEILETYETKLSDELSRSLTTALISTLSTEAISDWLGRCPLNFVGREEKP